MASQEQADYDDGIDEIVDDVIFKLVGFIDKYHFPYHRWFVGTTATQDGSSLRRHGVDQVAGAYKYVAAPSADVARIACLYFIEMLGSDGNADEGGEGACFVYVYKKNKHTKP